MVASRVGGDRREHAHQAARLGCASEAAVVAQPVSVALAATPDRLDRPGRRQRRERPGRAAARRVGPRPKRAPPPPGWAGGTERRTSWGGQGGGRGHALVGVKLTPAESRRGVARRVAMTPLTPTFLRTPPRSRLHLTPQVTPTWLSRRFPRDAATPSRHVHGQPASDGLWAVFL